MPFTDVQLGELWRISHCEADAEGSQQNRDEEWVWQRTFEKFRRRIAPTSFPSQEDRIQSLEKRIENLEWINRTRRIW